MDKLDTMKLIYNWNVNVVYCHKSWPLIKNIPILFVLSLLCSKICIDEIKKGIIHFNSGKIVYDTYINQKVALYQELTNT